MRSPLRIVAAALAVGIFGALAAVILPDADATPANDLAGVHVLQQVSSVAELTNYRSQLEAALRVPGVTALAVRAPWSAVDSSFAIFDLARQIATGTGDELTVRFMAGSHTPQRIKTACGSTWLLNGSFPKPYNASGALNSCFVDEYRTYVERLAAWARANDVHEIHLSHYAKDWAEFYWGPEVQAIEGSGAAGQTAMVNATNALADVGIALSGPDLAFELPMSGHGPLMATSTSGPPGIAERVTQHVVSVIGTQSDRFFIQGNGWDQDGIWGADAATETRFDRVLTYGALLGVQMIQPQQYNWTQVFNVAEAKHATTAEVYLPSFTGAQSALLKSEAAAFQPYVPAPTPPPTSTTTTPAPTTTTSVPPTTVEPTTTTTAPAPTTVETTTTLPSTTTVPPTTTTTEPQGTCQAVWEGTVVESRQTTQAACSLPATS